MKLLYLSFLLVFSNAVSQDKNDSLNLISYNDLVGIRANFDTNVENYIFDNREQNSRVDLFINNKTKASIGIDYKFISASISFAPAFFPGNNQDYLKGESTYTDIKLQLFPGRILQQVRYKDVKGFYIENTQDFLSDWQKGKDPYIQLPGFRVQTFGGSTAYFFNKNFSLKATLFQREWQTLSAGSLVPSLDYDLTYLSNRTREDNSRERQFNVTGNLSYYYNFVITPKVNISPYVSAGIGSKFSKFRNEDPDKVNVNTFFTHQYAAGVQAGYNIKRFFYGTRFNFSSYNYRDDDNATINNNNFYGLVFIGFRFAPPKTVEKVYDKIQEKIPIL